jgi:hypothetical protein
MNQSCPLPTSYPETSFLLTLDGDGPQFRTRDCETEPPLSRKAGVHRTNVSRLAVIPQMPFS